MGAGRLWASRNERVCCGGRGSSEVGNLDVAPVLLEIFGDESAVAAVGFLMPPSQRRRTPPDQQQAYLPGENRHRVELRRHRSQAT